MANGQGIFDILQTGIPSLGLDQQANAQQVGVTDLRQQLIELLMSETESQQAAPIRPVQRTLGSIGDMFGAYAATIARSPSLNPQIVQRLEERRTQEQGRLDQRAQRDRGRKVQALGLQLGAEQEGLARTEKSKERALGREFQAGQAKQQREFQRETLSLTQEFQRARDEINADLQRELADKRITTAQMEANSGVVPVILQTALANAANFDEDLAGQTKEVARRQYELFALSQMPFPTEGALERVMAFWDSTVGAEFDRRAKADPDPNPTSIQEASPVSFVGPLATGIATRDPAQVGQGAAGLASGDFIPTLLKMLPTGR